MYLHPSISQRQIVLAVAVVAAVAGGCATARLASGWAPSPVTANGIVDDWSDKQVCATMKDGLQLSVANDAERLYVMAKFRSNDPNWSRAAGRGGLTLTVAGPRKRTMSFRLPEGPATGEWGLGTRDSGPGMMSRQMNPMRAEFEGRLVLTDVDKNVVPVALDGSQGPAAGFSDDNGMCVYEFSVPLQDTALGHYSLGAGAGTGLNLTVTAGPSAEMRKAMQEQRQHQGMPEGGRGFGGRPGGFGGHGGFGGGRGGHEGGRPGGQVATSPSVSVAVRLAAAP
jgi:hypothetical protein